MPAIDRNTFGAETTTDEVLEGIDLTGKVAFITGGAGGLGAETARALASKGASVTLGIRSPSEGEAVAASIREATGNPRVELAQLDLSLPQSIRQCAKTWLETHSELHLLINNAGVMACPLTRTSEGWEMQFAANHLGHFVLTRQLAPALRAGAPARIVNLSSAGHRAGNIDLNDIHYEHREYDKWEAYGQSKTANILFTRELDKRLNDVGIRAYAVHPGVIMTKLARHLTPEDIQDLMSRAGGESGPAMTFKPVEAGAATTVYAATAPELKDRGGVYLEDCRIAELAQSEDAPMGYAAYAYDDEVAARLWQISEEHIGERFDS
jgi:NAD(P)-dependent dehydrogenase (short-subunit alcohol dehydrogenase family)